MDLNTLSLNITDLDVEAALETAAQLVENKTDPLQILVACREGMEGVGRRFESGEYFVADLMLSASIFQEIMKILEPCFAGSDGNKPESKGKVLIATVRDDIHDIGKNLVISMLVADGFEVIDLGVNVEPTVICQEIKRVNPDILGLSCLLASTLDGIEDTIAEINAQGIRDQVKIIVGGAPVTEKLARQFGADAYGTDAYDAVPKCQALMGGATFD